MKIYTKTGDTGRTSLFGGKRVSKISARIDSIGEIDEVNSLMGIVVSYAENEDVYNKLIREQSNLLRLGADVATPLDADSKYQKIVKRITKEDIILLEKEIDEWDEDLEKLTKFILPGGTKASAFAHHTRSVCRRAERAIVMLFNEEEINPQTIIYLNRLSDWLFTLARYFNKLEGIADTINPN